MAARPSDLPRSFASDRPAPVLHVLAIVVLCCLPALFLLPVRWLDREPSNEITHESGDGEDQEPDGLLIAA